MTLEELIAALRAADGAALVVEKNSELTVYYMNVDRAVAAIMLNAGGRQLEQAPSQGN